jgi:hypothetical protein
MRQLREILRLMWAAHRSLGVVARRLGVRPGAVASVVRRARLTGLTWPDVEGLADDALEARLYGPAPGTVTDDRPAPDLAWMHRELRRPGVTLELLHVEYLAQHDDRRDERVPGATEPALSALTPGFVEDSPPATDRSPVAPGFANNRSQDLPMSSDAYLRSRAWAGAPDLR